MKKVTTEIKTKRRLVMDYEQHIGSDTSRYIAEQNQKTSEHIWYPYKPAQPGELVN